MDEQGPAPTTAELLEACSVLFGGRIMCSVAFLRCIRPGGIKDAYRRRLLETHPDRAAVLGQAPAALHDRIVAVQHAYSVLQRALRNGRLVVPDAGPSEPPPPAPAPAKPSVERLFYEGPLPQRPLRLGEYLYYRGVISWGALIRAICRQRRERPVLGEMAVQLDLLTRDEVRQIRDSQAADEKFGEAAVRLGLMSPGRVFMLLGRQRRMGRLFGEYLAEGGLITPARMARLIEENQRHNRRYGKR
jgi:hypothetical protein